jgi:hypothetical protein
MFANLDAQRTFVKIRAIRGWSRSRNCVFGFVEKWKDISGRARSIEIFERTL